MSRNTRESGLFPRGGRYGSIEPGEIISDDEDELLLEEERYHHIVHDATTRSQSAQKSDDHHRKPDKHNRRWSVLMKLEQQYGEGSDGGKLRNVSSKCVFATLMLTAFIVCCWFVTRTIFFNIQLNPELYDFIVVGGGPAGSVVTRRLLDDGASVLLLEAGDHTQFVIDDSGFGAASDPGAGSATSISEFEIPLLWSSVAQSEDRHWGPFNALGANPFKGVGGGAMHSAMLYIRALSSDIASWGVPSFDWASIEAAYNYLERYQIDNEVDSNSGRGRGGGLPTLAPGCVDRLGKSFVAAAVAQGEKDVGGFNAPEARTGAGCYEVNIENGKRVSPALALLSSYLSTRSKTPRLTLRTRATVRKVLLSKEIGSSQQTVGSISARWFSADGSRTATVPTAPTYRAIGVEYELGGEVRYAYLMQGPSRNSRNNPSPRNFESLRSVVLAAGALLTPKLLLNSGVGALAELRAKGVEPKVDSPRVGKGLRDHVAVGMVFQAAQSAMADVGSAYSFPQEWSRYVGAIQRALASGATSTIEVPIESATGDSRPKRKKKQGGNDGIPSSPGVKRPSFADYGMLGRNGISAGAFLASPYAANATMPDIQITVYPSVSEPHYLALAELLSRTSNTSSSTDAGIVGGYNQILITAALLHPEATFQVVLNESDSLLGNPSILPADSLLQESRPITEADARHPTRRARRSALAEKRDSALMADAGLMGAKSKRTGSASTSGAKTANSDSNSSSSSGSGYGSGDSSSMIPAYQTNIIPQALTEMDVQRLVWAVQRVREIVAVMQVQGSVLWELSPGARKVTDLLPNSSDIAVDASSASADPLNLNSWVRQNAFFQSNWVGTAAMGPSFVPDLGSPGGGRNPLLSFAARADSADVGSPSGVGAAEASADNKASGDGDGSSDASGSDVSGGDTSTVGDPSGGDPPHSAPALPEAAGDGGSGSGDGGKGSSNGGGGDQGGSGGKGTNAWDWQPPAVLSVVDEELRVRGVLALRVVDASVIPATTTGNVQATVQAVAYRAADFILRGA